MVVLSVMFAMVHKQTLFSNNHEQNSRVGCVIAMSFKPFLTFNTTSENITMCVKYACSGLNANKAFMIIARSTLMN
jgi:hypothetical protein